MFDAEAFIVSWLLRGEDCRAIYREIHARNSEHMFEGVMVMGVFFLGICVSIRNVA